MKRRLLAAVLPLVAAVLLAVTGASTSAAVGETSATQGHPWTGARGITESVASLAARQRLEDRRTGGEPRVIRERPEPGERPAQEKLPGPSTSQPRTSAQVAEPSSSLSTGASFLGAQSSESGFIPPDSMGSVGPTQVLVAVNGRIKVFDKQGNLGPLNVTDSNFFSSVRNGFDVTDPQVEYDRLSGRWFVSEVNFESTNNRVMLAVSSGPTITGAGSFTFFSFNQNAPPPVGTARFADYPQMGVDENAVYIGVNEFTSSDIFTGTSAFVIRKSSVLGAGPPVVTAFRNLAVSGGSGPFSPQPAQSMDPGVNEGYIVGVDNQSFGRLDVRRITDPGGTPSISGDLPVTVPATSSPLPVPAQGTQNDLDALDDRLFEAMLAPGPGGALSLWTAHNIAVNASGVGSTSGTGRRTASRWYELGTLSTTPSLVQSGTLFDPASSNPRYFWIPSIAANGQGHASLNTSTAGAGRFAEVASSGRLASDALGATQPFEITQASSSTYNLGGKQGNESKRWGDYSQTVVDPTDNQTFWTFQEYANATDSWGVRVIQRKAPPPATPTTASPGAVPLGQPSATVEVTGTSSEGSGFFDPGSDPGGPGFPNHISATVSGGVVVNGVTYTDPTHVTLDLDTTGASNGSQDVTITNPDAQSSTGSNLLVTGSDTTPPDPPTLNGTNPASPANENSPKVFGAAEGGSTVRLYTDAACTVGPVGTGTAGAFASPGIPVDSPPVNENSTTTFHATATDAAGNPSACSTSSVTYVEDSTIPPAPTITATNPASPSNASTTPLVKGGASAETETVEVFTQANCGGSPAGDTTKAAFEGAGIEVTVGANQTTQLSARAHTAANASPCSASFPYTHDTIPPTNPALSSPSHQVNVASNDNTVDVSFTGASDSLSGVDGFSYEWSTSPTTTPDMTKDADATATGTTSSPLADGSHYFHLRTRDKAGNWSSAVHLGPFVIDTVAPAPPTSLATSPASPANNNSPKVSGSPEAGSTVRVYRAATTSDCTSPNLAATGTAAAFAPPGLTVSVADNTTTTFRATATDAAGNPSACSTSSVTYVEDSTLSGPPSQSSPPLISMPPLSLTDSTPPNGKVTASPKQKAGSPIALEASCDEPCTAIATGVVVAKAAGGLAAVSAKRKFKLGAARAEILAFGSATLKLLPKGNKARRKKSARALRKLVRGGAKAKAKVGVTLTDRVGNAATERLVVKLKR